MVVGDPTVSLKQSAFVSVASLGKEDRQSPPIRELVANASPLLGKVIVRGHDVQDSILHVRIISEDAEDSKGTKQNSLGFQSLFLLARLDRVLTREDDDKANDDGEDGEGDDLAVHAPIITHSPAYASPCTSFLVDLS